MRLIDADELQKRICGAKCGCEYEECGNDGDCVFGHFIFHSPTVDIQPVRYGKWIKVSEFMPIYCCSECKERNLFDSNGNNVLSDCCPKCGARMDGE